MLRKAWNDPVWSKVIAGAILAAAGGLFAYFLGWWPAIIRGAVQQYALPNWLLILLALAALPTPILMGAALWYRVFPTPAQSPPWAVYTSDVLLGVRWRWRYGQGWALYDLTCFCPACDFQVYAATAGAFRAAPLITFRCDSCGRHIADFDGSVEELESKVTRLIQQKLRIGAWHHPVST
jgi:hypothetical protein